MRAGLTRNAFTLVELIVVLALFAIAASLVTLNMRGPLCHARVNNALQQLITIDQFARSECKKCEVFVELEWKDGLYASLKNSEGVLIRGWVFPRSVRVNLNGDTSVDPYSIKYLRVGGTKDLIFNVSDGVAAKKLCIAGATGQPFVKAGNTNDF